MEGGIVEQEDFNKIFTELLEYVGKENFEISKDEYCPRIHKKERDSVKSQIFWGGILDDKKRIVIYTHKSTDIITSFLDEKDCVYDISKGKPISVYLYPNANKELLNIKSQPTEGNVQIVQGEYAITKYDDPNPVLSTQGIASCTGLLLYEPETKCGGVGHVDHEPEIGKVYEEMFKKLESLGGKSFILGYTPNMDSMRRDVIANKYKHKIIEEIELPEDFSFDTREGKIHPYKDSFDSTFEKRMNEKTDYRLNEHIEKQFCIYEPAK